MQQVEWLLTRPTATSNQSSKLQKNKELIHPSIRRADVKAGTIQQTTSESDNLPSDRKL
jgi:hypothetical protein